MRTIERASLFKKDYKRVQKQPRHAKDIEGLLKETLKLLVAEAELPPSMEDHPLSGDWKGYRDCHIKPDLLLIYKKTDHDVLRLARLGSHSELFK
jgi:mRNA interferase YafQ